MEGGKFDNISSFLLLCRLKIHCWEDFVVKKVRYDHKLGRWVIYLSETGKIVGKFSSEETAKKALKE